MKLKITDITISDAMQIRVAMNESTVSDYEELITEGAIFPAVDVWKNDGANILLAGFHRVEASRRAGLTDIEATVWNFDNAQDALSFACKTNATHGLRLSSGDKRNAIAKIIAINPELSNIAVAELVGVSDHTVKAQRDTMGASAKPDKTKGKDGKMRPATVKREPKERDEIGDGETDAPPPDTGMGGEYLSPEKISEGESHSSKIGKADIISKCDAIVNLLGPIIERLTKDEYKTLSKHAGTCQALAMEIKAWVK